MSVKITEKRNDKMLRALKEAERIRAITVGIHEEAGAQSYADGKTLAEIAEINEYGLGPPARPFISGWAEAQRGDITARINAQLQAAIKAGKSPIAALEQLALVLAGECQANISAGIAPANAEATIAKKGSDTPLIDESALRAAIAGKVDA